MGSVLVRQISFQFVTLASPEFDRYSVFFFGGLSIHLSTALLAHLFSYDMYVLFVWPESLC